MRRESQKQKILAWLLSGKTLTQQQAAGPDFMCWRLAARISELRDEEYDIHTTLIGGKFGANRAKYHINIESK